MHAFVPLLFPVGGLAAAARARAATTSAPRWSCSPSSARCCSPPGCRRGCSCSPARRRRCWPPAWSSPAATGWAASPTWLGRRLHRPATAPASRPCHGLYALADGGWWGVGLGASREKWSWLPEAHNDFIFAIIGEELGLPGTLVVLGLFAVLACACYRLVSRTDDFFVRVASAGVMAWLLGQASSTSARSSACCRSIGVPLPLVSAGGSALVTTLFALGMLMSFARNEPGCAEALSTRVGVVRRSLAVLPARRTRSALDDAPDRPRSCWPAAAPPGTCHRCSPWPTACAAATPTCGSPPSAPRPGSRQRLVPARGYPLRTIPKVPFPRRPATDLARLPASMRARRPRGRCGHRRGRRRGRRRLRRLRLDARLPRRPAPAGSPSSSTSRTPARAWPTGSGARMTPYVATTFAVDGAAPRRPWSACRCAARSPGSTATARRATRRWPTSACPTPGPRCWSPAARWARSGSTPPSPRASRPCAPPGVQVLHVSGLGKEFDPAASRRGRALRRRCRTSTAWTSPTPPPTWWSRRAGANTVCELTAVGLPAVYVPLPIGNGEQRVNAADVVAAGGGVLVDDGDVTPAWVDAVLLPLLGDAPRLEAMAAAAAGVGEREADERLADMVRCRSARTKGPPVSTPSTRFDFSADVPAATTLGRVHFIAIGGAGMSGVARVMLARGIPVSGSDAKDSLVLRALAAEGAGVHVGHDAAHVDDVDTVVISSAIRESNVELAAARARGLRVLHRSQALASLMQDRRRVAVAGANGKTTTTSMLTVALQACGADPSFAVGGELAKHGTNAHHGTGDVFVAEADESDGSFLVYRPEVAIVTNVQPDHLDFYGTFEAVQDAYVAFARTVSARRAAGRPAPTTRAPAPWPRSRAPRACASLTYGFAADSRRPARRARRLRAHRRPRSCTRPERPCAACRSASPDGTTCSTPPPRSSPAPPVSARTRPGSSRAWPAFTGTRRRFEPKGEADGVRVVDDYAHNPGKVAAVVETGVEQAAPGRLVVVFQPHLYSRTRDFAGDLAAALSPADVVVVMDVYAAREDPVPGVSGALVADRGRAAAPRPTTSRPGRRPPRRSPASSARATSS